MEIDSLHKALDLILPHRKEGRKWEKRHGGRGERGEREGRKEKMEGGKKGRRKEGKKGCRGTEERERGGMKMKGRYNEVFFLILLLNMERE